jgi:EAL domain-containing protein (putative c-di-GMP-specific phosphodiesterase class I)
MGQLGEAVLDKACAQSKLWRDAGLDLYLSVNVSGSQLTDECLPARVAAIMARTGMPPQDLWLEITETDLVEDLDQAGSGLRQIQEQGVRISIDDFGTGWASLTYLREFPVHALKIDRLFVAGLGERPQDLAIIKSILAIARELGLHVIAEGIETLDQRARLYQLGCERGQGYFFAHPAPAEELFRDLPVLPGHMPKWRHADNAVALTPSLHAMHLYDSDDDIVAPVVDMFEAAIDAGRGVLLVATPEHRSSIEHELRRRRVRVDVGLYRALDAPSTLDALLVDGVPDRGRFGRVVGTVVEAISAAGCGVTVYGEMARLLREQGQLMAAMRLEYLWNELAAHQPLTSLRGYRRTEVATAAQNETWIADNLRQVQDRLERIIPAREALEPHT